jgi:hypothetical protein
LSSSCGIRTFSYAASQIAGTAPTSALLESLDGAMSRTRRAGQYAVGMKMKYRNRYEEGVPKFIGSDKWDHVNC